MRKVEAGIPLLPWRDIRVGHRSEKVRWQQYWSLLFISDLDVFLTFLLPTRVIIKWSLLMLSLLLRTQIQLEGASTSFCQTHIHPRQKWSCMNRWGLLIENHNPLLSESQSIAPTLILPTTGISRGLHDGQSFESLDPPHSVNGFPLMGYVSNFLGFTF